LQALIRANQRALKALCDQPDLALGYLASFMSRLTRDEVVSYYDRYIGPYYTVDGKTDIGAAQIALDSVAAELGVESRPAEQTLAGQAPIDEAATSPRVRLDYAV
jgi:hypothetical protein